MRTDKLLKIGGWGTVITGLCCFTPFLPWVLGLLGLAALTGYLDTCSFPSFLSSWPSPFGPPGQNGSANPTADADPRHPPPPSTDGRRGHPVSFLRVPIVLLGLSSVAFLICRWLLCREEASWETQTDDRVEKGRLRCGS